VKVQSVVLCLTLCAAPSFCGGALRALDGTERGFWERHAVIIASVVSIRFDRERAVHRVEVEVFEVLSTEHPIRTRLVLYSDLAGRDSALAGMRLEAEGRYILCVHKTDDGWSISTSGLSFMLTGRGAEGIDDWEDPEIKRVQERIEKARAKSRSTDKAAG
jgi:hypothetical protein